MGDISTAQKVAFQNAFIHLYQQDGSLLRSRVREDFAVSGKAVYFDRIGAAPDPQVNAERQGDTPIMNSDFTRRKVVMVPWEIGFLTDRVDIDRIIADPTQIYVQDSAYSLGRKVDDIIIASAIGTAYTGEDGSTTAGLPAGNVIAFTYGDTQGYGNANAGVFSVEKILRAKRLLTQAFVPEGPENRFMVIDPISMEQLLNSTKIGSVDYNPVRMLYEGNVNTFAGFTFMQSNRLATSGTTVSNLCFGRKNIGLAVMQNISVKVGEDPGKKFNTRIYASMDVGATRILDEGVIHIPSYYA